MADTVDGSPIIQLRGICYAYPGQDPVLKDLDFDLFKGDRIGLLAPNGSGKTTLFHVIMGLLPVSKGSIHIHGNRVETEKDFIKVRRQIGLLFQDADDQLFSPTVLDDVAFGPLNMGKSKEEAIAISRQVLSFLGLAAFEDRITFKLSGGEKKLVSLATVLSMNPGILLLDEPLNGLDNKTRVKLVEVLKTIDVSYVIISHDIDFLLDTTDSICAMEQGKRKKDTTVYAHTHDHAHMLGHIPHLHE
jgi:cobalt/nickel transport system ATP-binding protein